MTQNSLIAALLITFAAIAPACAQSGNAIPMAGWSCRMLNLSEAQAIDFNIHVPVRAEPAETSPSVGYALPDFTIATPRLILRPWRDGDLPFFAEQNADPTVMQFITGPLTRAESDAYVERAIAHFAQNGFCKWAVEAPGVAPFIGAVGLTYVKFDAPFTPAVEVAWRINRRYRGQGYATEAAQAAIADGFNRVGLREIFSMTALANAASIKVMERLGMIRAFEFDHPHHPDGDPHRRHILYRTQRAEAN